MKKFLRIFMYLLANACIVLGAIYITFYILDQYNPMLLFLNGTILTRYLYLILPGMAFLFGLLFIIYYWSCKKSSNSRRAFPGDKDFVPRRPPLSPGRNPRR
jgi:uncharacterized BrkB/YihY/UPF0761 family membrane protein